MAPSLAAVILPLALDAPSRRLLPSGNHLRRKQTVKWLAVVEDLGDQAHLTGVDCPIRIRGGLRDLVNLDVIGPFLACQKQSVRAVCQRLQEESIEELREIPVGKSPLVEND